MISTIPALSISLVYLGALVQWFINTITYFYLCREAFWECQGQVNFMQQIIKIAPRKPPFAWLGDLLVITLKT